VERLRLSAAIGDAIREVMNAERLLAAAIDVDGAARSLDAWTAILDSRITRLNSFELRYRGWVDAGRSNGCANGTNPAVETVSPVESYRELFNAPTTTSPVGRSRTVVNRER